LQYTFSISQKPFHHFQISIDKNLICDYIINCDNGEDEMNCTDDGRFYCENGIPLFVRSYQV